MPKKKKHEEHENLERWLVSYADFITLLFAFFVVMYSISSVNEGKFRVLSQSIVAAFNPSSYSAPKVEIGPNMHTDKTMTPQIEEVAQFKKALEVLEREGKVNIFQDSRGIVLRMVDTVFFESGRAEIRQESIETLDRVAEIIKRMPNSIRVEGHTDNIPIHTTVFPSNWELSASRAISIVKQFTQDGMDPLRQEAVGYGEYRPIASNDSLEGQSKNRRVDIVILNRETSPRIQGADILGQITVQ